MKIVITLDFCSLIFFFPCLVLAYKGSSLISNHYLNFYFGFAEIMNLRNLERVLAREEEVKRRAIVHKTEYDGPQIRYVSKDGNIFGFIVILSLDSVVVF